MTDALITVLGGSAFIGREVVELLERAQRPFAVANRGRPYWGYRSPDAVHISCDRSDDRSVGDAASALRLRLPQIRPTIHIIDFSCDDGDDCARWLRAVASRGISVGRYVLISSDSVYDCRPRAGGVDESSPTVSAGARGYAGMKLRGELALREAAAVSHAYILRLPDVIGPRDNTGRFWATRLWGQCGLPLLLKESAVDQPVHFVFSRDVATVAVDILTRPTPFQAGTYNLACTSVLSIQEAVTLIGGADVAVFGALSSLCSSSSSDSSDDEASCDYFPCVRCGPLTTAAAVEHLNWSPTPVREAIAATNLFFDSLPAWSAEWRSATRKLPPTVRAAILSQNPKT